MHSIVHAGFVLAVAGQTNGSQPGTQLESRSQMMLDSPGNLPGIL